MRAMKTSILRCFLSLAAVIGCLLYYVYALRTVDIDIEVYREGLGVVNGKTIVGSDAITSRLEALRGYNNHVVVRVKETLTAGEFASIFWCLGYAGLYTSNLRAAQGTEVPFMAGYPAMIEMYSVTTGVYSRCLLGDGRVVLLESQNGSQGERLVFDADSVEALKTRVMNGQRLMPTMYLEVEGRLLFDTVQDLVLFFWSQGCREFFFCLNG